jgi:DNA transformation protein
MAGPDPETVAEMFAVFGRVSVRRMFSGAGVFSDGLMIALISRDVIYLKADERTIPAFEAEGLSPFSYQRKGSTRTINSFWRMPERLYDDPDELAQWAPAEDGKEGRKIKTPPREEAAVNSSVIAEIQATLGSDAACATSGSVSEITRLRPLRLAA